MLDLAVVVNHKRFLTQDVACMDLLPAGDALLPAFAPGAHIDLHIPGGFIRQYSLCNDSTERHRYQIAVLRDAKSRGGSVALCDRVHEGDVLQVTALRNNFRLHPGRRTLLLGGGIGVTPLLSMASRLHQMGRLFELHCYQKTRQQHAFYHQLQEVSWAQQVVNHFSNEGGGARQRIADLLASVDAFTHVYVCGPAGFVEHVINRASAAGLSERQVHYEPFELPLSMKPSLDGPAFDVQLRSSGKVYRIPANEPVTKVLERHGIRIPVSCEEGNCGTCQTGVIEGVPDHRDVYLTKAEQQGNRTFMPCCSRAKTASLTLDL